MRKPISIKTDATSLSFDGVRSLVISGEMHYARSPRANWPAILDESVACGLNCIASYVFWNYHEPTKGRYDFTGERDLRHFLQLCADRNLFVILRSGPYCCAEWNYGGFPPYLRDEPGIIIRTWNEPYLDRVASYFTRLVDEVRPYLATQGGPIILFQVENEYANVAKRYGDAGQRYLAWLADLAIRLGIDVPLIMCEGGAKNAIDTVNGFSIPDSRLEEFRRQHPDMPILWTELWPGWYDTWGFQRHERDVRNMAVHLLRFISCGGSGWNYYMWHAGTNFARTSMYLQTTRYGLDAPLDEYGRPTLKARYLARLHHLLTECQSVLLEGERRVERTAGIDITTWRLGDEQIELSLTDSRAVITTNAGQLLFDSDAAFDELEAAWPPSSWTPLAALDLTECRREPLPCDRRDGIASERPIEQLSLTHDSSDYCWYSSRFAVDDDGPVQLDIPYCGDMLYIYVDEQLVTQTQPPFIENRGATATRDDSPAANDLESISTDGYHQQFEFNCTHGAHRLDIMAVSLGMVKGDWQISGSMQTECKGIWQAVFINSREVTGWEMHPGLEGEKQPPTQWSPIEGHTGPCTWLRASFKIAAEARDDRRDFRLDAAGLGKGMLILNGHALGRYWLITGEGSGPDEVWQDARLNGLSLGPAHEPTQRYYHLPRAWLREENTLLIFEEQVVDARRLRVESRQARLNLAAR